jgi:murein DD-endopeptidase MepM/ murein hydrolase activator NlpD
MLSTHRLRTSATELGLRAQRTLHRHPRRVAAAAMMLLGGFAATAFGIAPLAPDAAQLPQTVITEAVPLPDTLAAQIDALAAHGLTLTRSDISRASDSADSLLRRLGVSDPVAAAFIRNDRDARRLLEGKSGKMLQAQLARDGSLLSLVARYQAPDDAQELTHFSRLTIERSAGQWRSRIELAPLVPQVRLGSGTIRSSLFAATDEAGLPDSVAIQLAEMFAADIDFHRQLRRGDTFSVIYDALTADGLPIPWNEGAGRVRAAEFVNDGRSHQAVWFDTANGKGSYFGFDGQSRRRAFLASPLEFSRVTSGFAMRMHPVLGTMRAHLGVDYGAPTGTPVRSVGDGVVEFAGTQRGYGNLVTIKHDARRSTTYAHLSKIDVKVGQRVEQGARVGAVGSTGMATGPHLHFEFRIDGQHEDPQEIARASEALTIEASARPRFTTLAQAARAQLDAAHTMSGFRGDAE